MSILEKTIINSLLEKNLTDVNLDALVEIESTFDEDGDELIRTASNLLLSNGHLFVYYDGIDEDIWRFSELNEDKQKEIKWLYDRIK